MSQFTLMQKRAIISAITAVVVHAVIFALWVLLITWNLPIFAIEFSKDEPLVEPEMLVVLRPFVSKPPPRPIFQPEPKKPLEIAETTLPSVSEQTRKFARTSAEQAGTPDAPTDLLGERDTRAASELAPTPDAKPNTPSQDGINPRYPGQVETVVRKHQDGSLGMDKTGPETETPQDATAARDKSPVIKETPLLEKSTTDQEDSVFKKNTHLQQGEKIPSKDPNKGSSAAKPKVEDAPKEKPNMKSDKDGDGGQSEQDPKKGGFSGHSQKTKITGSISRRGESSLNVKNTPLGRYQALVSKAVELQWRRNCEQHRDHIVPGVMSLRFYVDKNGGVSGIKFQEIIEGNYIEQGFTQRAIRQTKLPAMPRSVLKELKGEPLELIYNFYF